MVKSKLIPFLFLLSAFLLGCLNDFPIGDYTNLITVSMPKKPSVFIGCQLTYSLESKYKSLNDNNQMEAISKSFNLWKEAYPSLRFTDVSNKTEISNIKIYFVSSSDTIVFKRNISEDTFLESPSEELSTIVQKNGRQFDVYLNMDHKWDVNQISRTLLFHVGHILGLSPSEDSESVMFPRLTSLPLKINNVDKENLKKAIPRGCQIWLEKKVDLPLYSYYTMKTFRINDRVFALVVDIFPKYNLLEFNPNLVQWEKRKAVTLNSKGSGHSSWNVFTFGTSTHGYIGIATSFSNSSQESGEMWQYDPTKNEWAEMPIEAWFPKKSYITNQLYYFGTDAKGYLSFFNSSKYVLWEFDPSINKWTEKQTPEELTTYAFPIFIHNKNKMYFYFAYTKDRFFEYSPASNQWFSSTSALTSTRLMEFKSPFADEENVYLPITEINGIGAIQNHRLWVFSVKNGPSSQWELLSVFPEKALNQNLGIGFICQNRIFVHTSENTVWEYLP